MTALFEKTKERLDYEPKQVVLFELLDRFYGYLEYTEERMHEDDLVRYKEFKTACLNDISLMLSQVTIEEAVENIHKLSHMLVDGNFMVRAGLEQPRDGLKFPGNWD